VRTDAAFVASRLARLERRIKLAADSAAAGGGEAAARVRVVGVTKYLAAAQMGALRQAGLMLFGENRVQDALPKLELLRGEAAPQEWHFIGTVQGNKARAVTGRFALIHSVDRLELARRISQAATEQGLRQDVLLEVNISGEASKHGFEAAELEALWPELARLPGLGIRGLMGMAAEDAPARPAFRALRLLRDRLDPGRRLLGELSMGMSGDFEAAVAEGATLLRIGRSLFSEEAEI
jgi:hypothetical protein